MEPTLGRQSTDDPQRKVAVVCPQCRQGYRIAARLLGRRLICRHCRSNFRAREADSSDIKQLQASKSDPPSDSGRATLPGDSLPSAGTSSVAIDTRWAGQKLGRYKVLSVLGQGGMGVAWRAHDDVLRRDVALKILNRNGKTNGSIGGINTDLFMQEARAVAKLQHPAVVSIFEVVEDQGQVFLALELMEGGTLKEYVDAKGPLSPRDLFRLMVGPAKALALAHDRGIIHRDIKPGNLMFDDHGHLKLMDFGLADVAHEEASEKIRGKAVGSLGWIAPETARGHGTTKLSDIYGLGLVLLFALTGKAWLKADSRSKLIALHQNPPPVDLSHIKGLTPMAEALLRKCLSVDPAERYQCGKELATALQACADEDPGEKTRRRRSHATMVVVGVIFGAIVAFGGALYAFLSLVDRENELRQPAQDFTNRPVSVPEEEPAPAPKAPITPATPVVPDKGALASQGSVQFANVKEAKVPWPRVPNLIDPASFQFVGTANGKVYHLSTTECGRSIYASNLVTFKTAEEAQAGGRKLCERCLHDTAPQGGMARGQDEEN